MKLAYLFTLYLSLIPLLSSCALSPEAKRMENSRILQQSSTNLMQLGLAIKQYSLDHKGMFPPMQNVQAMRQALSSYTSASQFANPITKNPYLPNPGLSKKKVDSVKAPNFIAMLYESKPLVGPNNKQELFRPVCFVTGNVKTVKETEWPQIKRQSKIP